MTKKAISALLSKLEEELKGRILQVDDYTFIRVESLSFTKFPETSYPYEALSRYLDVTGRIVSVHTYCGKHKADLTAYKSECIKLPTAMPVPEYDAQDLLCEITKTYPVVQNTNTLKAKISEAQSLINNTIDDFFKESLDYDSKTSEAVKQPSLPEFVTWNQVTNPPKETGSYIIVTEEGYWGEAEYRADSGSWFQYRWSVRDPKVVLWAKPTIPAETI